jgi:methyl-accepting chemotaxis protein
MSTNPINWIGRALGALVPGVRDLRRHVDAIGRTTPIIHFDMSGRVVYANEQFLKASGYRLEEIRGQHHRMFVDADQRDTPAYHEFWARLRAGETQSAQYKRQGKDGKPLWVQATYYPILDSFGTARKVIKHTVDVTSQMLERANGVGQAEAISKAQAVLELALDGTVIAANPNFLNLFGYALEEVRGRHHSLFVDAIAGDRSDYRALWSKLARGEYEAGQYKRLGKGGRELWVQASFNPILDAGGKPFKIVEYATDVTAQISFSEQLRSAVGETRAVVSAAAAGDLQRRISLDGKSGDVAELSGGVNELIDVMMKLVEHIKGTAGEVLLAAEEISTGNGNLSQRTASQASSLEQTASSMEEMASTVKQTADNAAQANQLAIDACAQAEKGGAVVGAVVSAMSGINTSSNKIADIIGVIDEIAFQTNLLALNAAVEAARAGEQGRGFAVVASEVRSLAGRSATAAKEIKALIQDSVVRVSEGSRLVDESGRTLDGIVNAVKKVSTIVAEIASASREQSIGIDQVNKAVMQMDEGTQQNAALVEQAAAASESIVEQVQSLNSLIARYKVAASAHGRAAAALESREWTPDRRGQDSRQRSRAVAA